MHGAFCFAVPNMPQQRQDQHHQSTMMHPASAAGPPIVATPPAYSTQYVAYSPQQFPNQPLVQHVPHYQSQVRDLLVYVIWYNKYISGSVPNTTLSPVLRSQSVWKVSLFWSIFGIVMCFKAFNSFKVNLEVVIYY